MLVVRLAESIPRILHGDYSLELVAPINTDNEFGKAMGCIDPLDTTGP